MVGKKKRWLLTMVITFYGVMAFAQGLPGQSVSPDIQEEAAKYEQYFEVVLDNSLSDYYKSGSYIVDVKAALERVLVPKGYDVIEADEPVRIENLPGLPFLPPGLQRNTPPAQDSLRATGFDSRFRLTRLNIKVLVDTSYSDEDLEFVEEAATLIANADRFRGDIVSVERKVFPRSARGIDQDAPRKQTPVQQPGVERIGEEPEQAVLGESVFLGIDWNDPKQLMYVIAGLGLLFVVALFWAIFKKPSKKDAEEQRMPFPMYEGMYPGLKKPDEVEEKKGPDAKTLALFEEDKTYLTNTCISNPKIVADMVSQWIASDDEQGVIRSVRSFASVDEKLLSVIEPHMNADTFETIKFGINNTDAIPLEEKIEEARAFRKSVQQIKISNSTSDSSGNLFDFVYQLTDQQLQHLMKDESDEMVAILLAQVAGERAGVILQKLEDQKRISILLKMGKIDNIPISVYKKVASHFSNKALSVSDMKYVAADGVDTLLTTIETLPLTEQDDYVRSIAEQDLELAKRIRKFFIGFDDLPKVKDEFVQKALEEIPSDTIILALRTAPAAVREKVLRVRPKREQQLILSEIDNPSEASKSEIEDAQKAVLYAVRRKMKTEG